MKQIIILIMLSIIGCTKVISSVNDDVVNKLEEKCYALQKQQKQTENIVFRLKEKQKRDEKQIRVLCDENGRHNVIIDSLQNVCSQLEKTQANDRKNIKGKIDMADAKICEGQDLLENRTLWGGIIAGVIIIILMFTVYIFYKRIKKGTSTIDDVRKAQNALQAAQAKMQESSVRLDNQMLTLIQHQIENISTKSDNNKVDHSLAIKIADEIVRIELNLARMDSSVKGYKQLSKAVERIKNNFLANGYEIIDMLGKPYNEGMKVVANFVPDDNLKEGEQIITGITKPQINYNGQMIQSAQITVSQNI